MYSRTMRRPVDPSDTSANGGAGPISASAELDDPMSHDPTTGDLPGVRTARGWWLAFALLPLAVYVVGRPDLFHMQHGFDPFVYRGYAEDLGTMLERIGDRHYFVTRWSLYLPARVCFVIFGTVVGYLVHHVLLLALAVVPLAIWTRERWGRGSALVVAAVVLCSPVVLRSIFTEYSDAVAVPCLMAAEVLLLARWRRSTGVVSSLGVGVLVAAAVIANPFSLGPAVVLLASWSVWQIVRRRWWALVDLAVQALGFASTIAFGLVLFRWRYGIADVYAPTLDFVEDPHSTDPIAASNFDWLGSRLWIYLPLLLFVAWTAVWGARRRRPPAEQIVAVAAMSGTASMLVWLQFSGELLAFEVHFYWSYQVPTLLVMLAIVIGESWRDHKARIAASCAHS